jgi:hypothetical protein
MAFNITSWSQKGRDFGRGSPPPRGSIEYVGVGDMWQPDPKPQVPRTAVRPAPSRPATPSTPRSPIPPAVPAAAPAAPAAPTPRSIAGPVLIALSGAACLGLSYLLHRPPKPTVVGVPDALPKER